MTEDKIYFPGLTQIALPPKVTSTLKQLHIA
jgi:hypothetical protein